MENSEARRRPILTTSIRLSQQKTSVQSQQQTSVLSQQQASTPSRQKTPVLSQQLTCAASEAAWRSLRGQSKS